MNASRVVQGVYFTGITITLIGFYKSFNFIQSQHQSLQEQYRDNNN